MTAGVALGMRGRRGLRAPVIMLSMCLLGAVMAGDAAAATGDLIQKPGVAGCVSDTNLGNQCTDGTALGRPFSVVVSPDGKNAYVGSTNQNAVTVFDRAPDGTLTQKAGTAGCISETGRSIPTDATTEGQCVDGRALRSVQYLAVSPDGRNVYTASAFSSAVAIFDRAPDGTLTQKAGTAGCISETGTPSGTPSGNTCVDGKALNYAINVAVSPDGKSVYVADYSDGADGAVAVFDRAPDGTLSQKAGTAGCISETGTPSGTPLVNTCVDGRALAGPQMVTVSPDGKTLYFAAYEGSAVAVFDRALDGTLTQKPGQAGCLSETVGTDLCADGRALDHANWVEISPDGKSAYVASYNSHAVAIFDRASGGTLTQKPGTAGCVSDTTSPRSGFDPPPIFGQCVEVKALDKPVSVTVSPDGKNVYATSQDSDAVVMFDRAVNGALTQKPGAAGCVSNTGRSIPDQTATNGECVAGRALDFPYTGLTVSPDGKNVYVAAVSSNAVAVLDREPAPVIRPAPPSNPLPAGPAAPFAGCPNLSANVIRGTAAGNTINGSPGADRIFAGTGDDVVDALAGNDCVDLGTGNDRGQGGLGNDLLISGTGRDRVSGSSGNDNMRGNSGNDRLDGGRGTDRVTGDAGNDSLLGSFGNDRLHGVSGRDLITGSRGRDRINGGSGNDRISGGSSGDRIAGDAGSDRLNGNSGPDRISGNSGNDRITSRDNSRDRVTCGTGRDSVVADRRDIVSRNCERVRRR